jgi:hypothetical protein
LFKANRKFHWKINYFIVEDCKIPIDDFIKILVAVLRKLIISPFVVNSLISPMKFNLTHFPLSLAVRIILLIIKIELF